MKFLNFEFSFKGSNTCSCDKYLPIELTRDEISKRIKDSKGIKKALELKSDTLNGQQLYQCSHCQQFWQSNWAWNWGNKEYLFKVPAIKTEDWKVEPYMAPDQMLLYTALMSEYFEKNTLIESEKECKDDNCYKNALTTSPLCQEHFIQNLQEFNLLPKKPVGRLFEPYFIENSGMK